MARSCFKVITCAGDGHDLDSPKRKDSRDKRGWSFRKKSSINQAINNTVILEAPPVSNNQILQSTPFKFDSHPDSTIEEKTSIVELTNDTTHLSTPVSPTLSEIAIVTKKDDNVVNPDESVIIIQTGVRRFLAEVEVVKQKKIVKLQAAVRGHLVRRHAVGTLRCVLAIVRIQALVRTHQQSKLPQKLNHRTQRPTYVSIERLLSNKFAKQLLESTPRVKSINIKCDPSRSDTAWKWLERWMAVSPGLEQSPNLVDNHDIKNQVVNIAIGTEDKNVAHHEKSEFHPIQTTEYESVSDKPGLVAEQSKTDGRKSTSSSRKSSDPAFIAAQSKFEELTSVTANKDSEAEPLQSISKLLQIGSSDCGTELSVTSTLDSPDYSEIEPKKIEIEADVEPPISVKNEESATPRSHITVFESQGTPSSQLSTKTRKARGHKKPESNPNSNSNPKRKSSSGAGKKSPINSVSQDMSGNSFEITGKRRNSLGSPRTDGEQQEQLRDFSSLPSYMQTTESAKAKALASNSSPRSSPDVQGKEFLIRKRHSLPVSNGRQESPRIQRSMSQAHQTVKGNGSSSQEKKWQR